MKYKGKFFGSQVFVSDDVDGFELRQNSLTPARLDQLKDAIKTQRAVMPHHPIFAGLITLEELETLISLAESVING